MEVLFLKDLFRGVNWKKNLLKLPPLFVRFLSILCISPLHKPFMVHKYTKFIKNSIKYRKTFFTIFTWGDQIVQAVSSLCVELKRVVNPVCIRSSCWFHFSKRHYWLFLDEDIPVLQVFIGEREIHLKYNWDHLGEGIYIINRNFNI